MFFYISKSKKENFPYNHQTKNFVISLDEGWSQTVDENSNPVWFKGYLDQGLLANSILDIIDSVEPIHLGNFCVIRVTDAGINLRSDRQRSFPIWIGDNSITNLVSTPTTIWSDDVIDLANDFTLTHHYFNLIGEVTNHVNSFEQVVDKVDRILAQKTKSFLEHIQNPIRVFLSGGIDTALVFSYIQKYTDNYEIIDNTHCDFDYFYLKNHDTLSKLWGYTQIHHWRDACVLASGAPGDEFMVRSPTTANLMLLHYGSSIPKLLLEDRYKDCLHYLYFNKEANFKMWSEQSMDAADLASAIKICANYNLNDWQHWHFGNTLTWTPLRDIEIFKLIASLSVDDLADQVMNSKLSKELIRRNNPEILTYISDQKNSENHLENLVRFYCK